MSPHYILPSSKYKKCPSVVYHSITNTNTNSVQVLGIIWLQKYKYKKCPSVGYLEMYYFQMERSLGGKEEGLDKVAEDRRARFLFILSSAPKQ